MDELNIKKAIDTLDIKKIVDSIEQITNVHGCDSTRFFTPNGKYIYSKDRFQTLNELATDIVIKLELLGLYQSIKKVYPKHIENHLDFLLLLGFAGYDRVRFSSSLHYCSIACLDNQFYDNGLKQLLNEYGYDLYYGEDEKKAIVNELKPVRDRIIQETLRREKESQSNQTGTSEHSDGRDDDDDAR